MTTRTDWFHGRVTQIQKNSNDKFSPNKRKIIPGEVEIRLVDQNRWTVSESSSDWEIDQVFSKSKVFFGWVSYQRTKSERETLKRLWTNLGQAWMLSKISFQKSIKKSSKSHHSKALSEIGFRKSIKKSSQRRTPKWIRSDLEKWQRVH